MSSEPELVQVKFPGGIAWVSEWDAAQALADAYPQVMLCSDSTVETARRNVRVERLAMTLRKGRADGAIADLKNAAAVPVTPEENR